MRSCNRIQIISMFVQVLKAFDNVREFYRGYGVWNGCSKQSIWRLSNFCQPNFLRAWIKLFSSPFRILNPKTSLRFLSYVTYSTQLSVLYLYVCRISYQEYFWMNFRKETNKSHLVHHFSVWTPGSQVSSNTCSSGSYFEGERNIFVLNSTQSFSFKNS